jgi:ribulose-phosphate 3-epimerase
MPASSKTVRIAPSILSADFARLAEEIAAVEKAGAQWIHVDVMDGHFVPNLTMGPLIVRSLRKVTKLPLDVHLMITRPEQLIPAFAEAGSDMITVHAEACHHLDRTIEMIKALNVRAGISLNPHTPPNVLDYVLAKLDLVLLMTVNPGFGGQSFLHSVVPKIETLRAAIDSKHLDTDLSVDGGINFDTAAIAKRAGADVLVAGQAVFGSPDYGQAIATLRSS